MEKKYRYLCFSCGAEQLIDNAKTQYDLICSTCGADNMFKRDKGKTLRTIRNILLLIAITVLVYVSYSIYHTEKAKSALREAKAIKDFNNRY